MSLDFEIDEISSLLGIKNKISEIENIIHKNENPSFLSAITLILKDPESQNLIPNTNISQNNQNEMFINFTENLNIKDIQQIELNEGIKESKFEESIKTKNNIFKNINLFFSQDYREKIKKDFIMPKEEEIEIIDASKYIHKEINNQIKKDKKPKKQKNKQNSNTNQIIIENENNKINTSINNEKNEQNQNLNKPKKNNKKSKNSSGTNIPRQQNKNNNQQQKYNEDFEGDFFYNEQNQTSQQQVNISKKHKNKKSMQTSPQPIEYNNNQGIEKKKKQKKKKVNNNIQNASGGNIEGNNNDN